MGSSVTIHRQYRRFMFLLSGWFFSPLVWD